ncbi:alpha/beta fold hydrolase [Candidatus Cyanaurora vandensis]|uniref:alpha/beta hydrolase family protein n=1 Tax=Candidatus Cyanaurora vandensis TaxID=2714958 RepID=UPI00257EE8F1|nr:alpha/beta fold hydrolase [Candidatus Cyanaurora vandensis]
MKPYAWGLALWLGLGGCLLAVPLSYTPTLGNQTTTLQQHWRDPARNREIPVKVYYPKRAGTWPVIIFSHGLGGSREDYGYLGQQWASQGYVVVHLQHQGSDNQVGRGNPRVYQALQQAAFDPRNGYDRALDVSFVLDRLKKFTLPNQARLDLKNVGAAGHSFGAFTALAVAGQRLLDPQGNIIGLPDPRVRAIIPMSAPVPTRPDQQAIAYRQLQVPALHMTGTQDDSFDTPARDRRIPYDRTVASNQFLITFKDGNHGTFFGLPPAQPQDARFQELIRLSSTAFWDSYLKADRQAQTWLTGGGLAKLLGTTATLEQK